MTEPAIPRRWTFIALSAVLGVAVIPPWFCIARGSEWWIPVGGALTWAIAVLAKGPAARLLGRVLKSRLSHAGHAAAQGVLSAAIELAAAALYFVFWPPPNIGDMLAFGVGAGSAEAAYILVLALITPPPSPEVLATWERGARVSLCVRYMLPIERFFALVGHTGARGLVAFAIIARSVEAILLFAFAFILFAAIDAVAVYGKLDCWKWSDPRVCRSAHAFFAGASMAQAGMFLFIMRHA